MIPATLERRAWIEATWAERNVYADHLNAERMEAWEARRVLILEADMPVSIPRLPEAKIEQPNVSPIRRVSAR